MRYLALVRRARPWDIVRRYASHKSHHGAPEHEPALIRNIALVAHIDSGKTTLTESILHASQYVSVPGSVDAGSTTTDFLPAERERGITIQSASIPVKWKRWTFNLVDTPGHADFGMEVESASRVVDGAVVLIDSVEGVEAQTKGVWRQLDRYSVPTRILFLNKLDRPGASFRQSFLSVLNHRLHPRPVILTLPIASFKVEDYKRAEPGIHGLVDLVNWEVWKWGSRATPTRHPLPRTLEELKTFTLFPESHPILEEMVVARTALVDALSEHSEELLDAVLSSSSASSYLELPADILLRTTRQLVGRQKILPVVCGSAFKNVGTALLMDFIGELLATPIENSLPSAAADANTTRMLAWKVGLDAKKGWMTFVRVYSGSLSVHDALYNPNQRQRERAMKLQLLYANNPESVNRLGTGSVGVILGLKHTRTGDTLISASAAEKPDSGALRDIQPPPAVISAAVIPQSYADLKPVQEALESLQRTDPSVRIEADKEGQLLVHGLGALHLEIVEGRLRDEYGVGFQFGARRVGYREGFAGAKRVADGVWNFNQDGKQYSITMKFALRALRPDEEGDPAWDGNVILDPAGQPIHSRDLASSGEDELAAAMHAIGRGIQTFLSNSLSSSLPLTGIHCQVMEWEMPTLSIPTSSLTHAANAILRNDFRYVGMGPILEPFVRVKVDVTEDLTGATIRDLTEHSGEILDLNSDDGSGETGEGNFGPYSSDGLYVPPDWMSPCGNSLADSQGSAQSRRTIHAIAPLSKMLDYLVRLRALSGGRGEYDMINIGFYPANAARRDEILREIGKL
ncbi:translation elongation factor 2 [Auricularia subglabra TFB-10046 SS5]|nr:translation elongation factor 2 [Auricularia subglabra TFB-10046 SS5]